MICSTRVGGEEGGGKKGWRKEERGGEFFGGNFKFCFYCNFVKSVYKIEILLKVGVATN